MLRKPCRKCGTPGAAICETCRKREQAARPVNPAYRDPLYARNRRLMIEHAWLHRLPCVRCGQPFGARSEITAEHLIPVRDGGTNELSNLGPCHDGCNKAWRR